MQLDTALLALLCGHFLGDFVLQSDRLAKLKFVRCKSMLYHVLQVSLLTWFLLGNFSAWKIVGILFVLHLLTDYMKNFAIPDGQNNHQSIGRSFRWFIGDQVLHVLTIIILWYFACKLNMTAVQENTWEVMLGSRYQKGLILLTGLAIGLSGVGIVVKYQMAKFAPSTKVSDRKGLLKGGKAIGFLERLLVFMFVLAGKPEGVGFVIAAKSVFRIGELTNKAARDHAEYIMIGTLRSFTYALVLAFITKWLIGQV